MKQPKLITQALLDILPLSIAVIPWGILTGTIAIQVGLSPWQGQLLSLIVFSGAAQLSGMALIGNMAAPLTIFGTTFVISSRHLLYSITFRDKVASLPILWRVSIAFLLTDEMFAVSESHTQRTGTFSAAYAIIAGFTFYAVWSLATLIGIVAGDYFKDIDSLGLDFAIAATFIAMTFNKILERPVLLAMLVSGISSVIIKPFFTDSHIIIAGLLGMCVGYAVSNKQGDEA